MAQKKIDVKLSNASQANLERIWLATRKLWAQLRVIMSSVEIFHHEIDAARRSFIEDISPPLPPAIFMQSSHWKYLKIERNVYLETETVVTLESQPQLRQIA